MKFRKRRTSRTYGPDVALVCPVLREGWETTHFAYVRARRGLSMSSSSRGMASRLNLWKHPGPRAGDVWRLPSEEAQGHLARRWQPLKTLEAVKRFQIPLTSARCTHRLDVHDPLALASTSESLKAGGCRAYHQAG